MWEGSERLRLAFVVAWYLQDALRSNYRLIFALACDACTEDEVHLLQRKRMVATIFLGLQAWFVVCGIINISIAYTTAHRTYVSVKHALSPSCLQRD